MADNAAAIHSTDVPTYLIATVGATGTGKSVFLKKVVGESTIDCYEGKCVFLKKVVGESTIDGYEATVVRVSYTLYGFCKDDKILARLVCFDVPGHFGVDFGGFEGIDANSPLGGVKAVLVFHDVTNSSSYSDAQRWCNLITSLPGHGVPVAICGTKVDLRNNETKVVGLDNQMKHFEISVKTDSMIKLQEPLLYLLTELMGGTEVEYLKAHAVSEPPAKSSLGIDLEAQNAPAAAAVIDGPVAREDDGWFGTTLKKIKECCMCCAPLVLFALRYGTFSSNWDRLE